MLAVSAVYLISGAASLAADEPIFTAIEGTCSLVKIASKVESCIQNGQILTSALPDGRILVTAPIIADRVLGFIGERDSQIAPGEYVVFLRRIRVSHRPDPGAYVDVKGTCKISSNPDKTIVYRVSCNAKVDNGAEYDLEFQGNGQPVTHPELKRPE